MKNILHEILFIIFGRTQQVKLNKNSHSAVAVLIITVY